MCATVAHSLETILMNEKAFRVISRETGIPEDQLSLETTIEQLKIDSLEFVDLMLVISSEIKDIPQERISYINTIGDIVRELQ